MNESIRARLPRAGGSGTSQIPPISPPLVPIPPGSGSQARRSGFLPVFWTIASILSLTVNVLLIIVLVLIFWMGGRVGGIQSFAMGQASGLLGGLYDNFVKMDQANIRTNIHVEKEIPVQFSLSVSGPANVTLSRSVEIRGARVWVQTGGLTITDANATIVLPAGVVLPINIDNLAVPVDQKVPAVLDVPVDIPLNQTELHEPFVGLRKVVEPWYCLIQPSATFRGIQVCSPTADPSLGPATP
jgi:hypothetical protein